MKNLKEEIKKLIRERKHIDAAIADFERLEVQTHSKSKAPERNARAKSLASFV